STPGCRRRRCRRWGSFSGPRTAHEYRLFCPESDRRYSAESVKDWLALSDSSYKSSGTHFLEHIFSVGWLAVPHLFQVELSITCPFSQLCFSPYFRGNRLRIAYNILTVGILNGRWQASNVGMVVRIGK